MADGAMLTDARNRYMKAMQAADELRLAIESKEAELRIFSPVQERVDRLSVAIFDLRYRKKQDAALYELRAQINAAFRDAGLCLYFFGQGVIYEVASTGQADVIITEENRESEALLAQAELVNHGLRGLKEVLSCG